MWNLVLMVLIVGWSGAAEGGDLKKCCPWDKVPGMNSTCNPKPEAARWESPRVFSTRGLLAPGARSMAEGGPVGRPQCSKPLFALDPDIDGPYYLLQDGRLDDEEYTRPFERFCYDWDPKLRVVPYICHEETESGNEVVTAYPIGLIVSLPFLAATFMVYVLLKELRNVYGLTLICNVVSLFIGYLGLTIVLLAPDDMSADACTVLGKWRYRSFGRVR
ncbi:hypothetical protein AAG570_010416 [Ranatra chinensis]|uniref:G-protein coupled receptors family 2 profile 2 domain-containing protein n=1 Tax=Ranatra chinensis TaxID=642074 RepID=A0ABD0YMH0_9HEMI